MLRSPQRAPLNGPSRLRAVCVALAVAVAYAAQGELIATRSAAPDWVSSRQPPKNAQRHRLGLGLYGIAAVLFGLGVGRRASVFAEPEPSADTSAPESSHADPRWLTAAVVAATTASTLQRHHPDTWYPTTAWALTLACGAAYGRIPRPDPRRFRRRLRAPDARAAMAWLGAIALLGFALRLYRLGRLPWNVHNDFTMAGLQARLFLDGETRNLFSLGWAAMPRVNSLPELLSMLAFGDTLHGYFLSGVIAGMLSLVGFHVLLRRAFADRAVAVAGTMALATNIAHIHFSRMVGYINPWAVVVFAVAALFGALRDRRRPAALAVGMLCGLALQMYYAGRIVLLLIPLLILYAAVCRPAWARGDARRWGLLMLGLLLVTGPYLVEAARRFVPRADRTSQVFILGERGLRHARTKYRVPDIPTVLRIQAELGALAFHRSRDTSDQFGWRGPMFSQWVSPWILLGFVACLRNLSAPGAFLLVAWWALNLIFGGILTIDPPFWPRLLGLSFAGAGLLAVGLVSTVRSIAPICRQERLLALAILACGTAAAPDWLHYADHFSKTAAAPSWIGRYLGGLPPGTRACAFPGQPKLGVNEVVFLAHPIQVIDPPPTLAPQLIPGCNKGPVAWVLQSQSPEALATLRRLWPSGREETIAQANGKPVATVYRID